MLLPATDASPRDAYTLGYICRAWVIGLLSLRLSQKKTRGHKQILGHKKTTPVPRVKGMGSTPTLDAARQHLTGGSPSIPLARRLLVASTRQHLLSQL